MAFIGNILGEFSGANAQKHQGDMAQGAANQASDAQNQLIQQTLMPIYQQLLDSYKSGGYQQLGGGVGQQMEQLLGGMNLGNTSGDLINALMSPQGRDNATGINGQGITQGLLQYLQNPQNTASSQINGQALAQYMDPNTNLAGANAQTQGYFGNPQQSNTNQQGNANLGYLNNTQNTNTQHIGGAANSYLMNGQTDVAGIVGRSAIDQLQGPTNLNGPGGVGQQALSYYGNEAKNGLDPSVIGAQINNYNNSSQRDINSIRNSLGAGTPNLAGTISDLGEKQFENRANLSSSLAGQDQGFRDSAMAQGFGAGQAMDSQQAQRAGQAFGVGQGVNNAAQSRLGQAYSQGQGMDQNMQSMLQQAFTQSQGMDANTMGMLQQYLQNAGNLDTQNFGRESAAQGTANNMDQQIQQMLGKGYDVGNSQQQQQLGNMNQGNATGMDIEQMLQRYLGGGTSFLTGAASGVGNIANQYGSAAAAGSKNAQGFFDSAAQTNSKFEQMLAQAAAGGG